MIIDNEHKRGCEFSELGRGDCFEFDHDYCMKISSVIREEEKNKGDVYVQTFNAVNLRTGCLMTIEEQWTVHAVILNAKVL